MNALIGKVVMWAGVVVAALLAMVGVFNTGRIRGKSEADVVNTKENAQRTVAEAAAANKVKVQTVEAANNVQREISNMPVGGPTRELFDKWSRPDPNKPRGG